MPSRLLLVEDDASIAGMYALALRNAGWHVDIAPSGDAGVALVGQEAHVAVILDLSLPGLSGAEVLRQIRAESATPALPALVVSNSELPELREDVLRLGAPFIVKSRTTPAQLVSLIESAVGRPADRRRQPRRLDDVLQMLRATTSSTVSELPLGAAALLAARGIAPFAAPDMAALRAQVAEIVNRDAAGRPERRRRVRRRA